MREVLDVLCYLHLPYYVQHLVDNSDIPRDVFTGKVTGVGVDKPDPGESSPLSTSTRLIIVSSPSKSRNVPPSLNLPTNHLDEATFNLRIFPLN